MKRRLVIYNEAVRHPFRQQLAPSILAVNPADLYAAQPRSMESIRLFLTSFTASFIAISLYIF